MSHLLHVAQALLIGLASRVCADLLGRGLDTSLNLAHLNAERRRTRRSRPCCECQERRSSASIELGAHQMAWPWHARASPLPTGHRFP